MPLTEMKVRNAKPREKFYKLSDSGGLYLHVTEKGSKLWRFKYRYDGKQKLLAFSTYPEISLLDARQKRDEARRLLAKAVDPGAVRKAQKRAEVEETETFEVIVREWHDKFKSKWKEGHALDLPQILVPHVKLEFCHFLFLNSGMPLALENDNSMNYVA